MKTKDMALIGLFAGLLAIISQISIPMPNGMPLTIQVFGVTLIGIILGAKRGFIVTIVYILIGAVGFPVFSNLRGGLGVLVGITGGYILGWPIMVIFCGIRHRYSNKILNLLMTILFSLNGVILNEIVGGLQWAALSGEMSIKAIITYSIITFLPKDMLITILAVFIGNKMRSILYSLPSYGTL